MSALFGITVLHTSGVLQPSETLIIISSTPRRTRLRPGSPWHQVLFFPNKHSILPIVPDDILLRRPNPPFWQLEGSKSVLKLFAALKLPEIRPANHAKARDTEPYVFLSGPSQT